MRARRLGSTRVLVPLRRLVPLRGLVAVGRLVPVRGLVAVRRLVPGRGLVPVRGLVPGANLVLLRGLIPVRGLAPGEVRLRAGRIGLAAAAVCGLAVAASAQGLDPTTPSVSTPAAVQLADRDADRASRSGARAPVAESNLGAVAGARDALTAGALDSRSAADSVAQAAAEAKAKAEQDAAAAAAAAAAKWAADNPTPVAGLSQKQMNNALRIVNEGKALGLPKRAYVLAVACAMQESRLLNLASAVLPESSQYPHEGSGSDHDSVGLFQQRPSSGWGSVKDLMTPAYAAKQFYDALVAIPGWQSMALTYAIQAVQISAFPDAYAQHASAAQTVVDALT